MPKKIKSLDSIDVGYARDAAMLAQWKKLRTKLEDRCGWRELRQSPGWLSDDDVVFLVTAAGGIILGDPRMNIFGFPALPGMKNETDGERFFRVFKQHPDEAAALFTWRREQARKKNKTKQGLAAHAIFAVRAKNFSELMEKATIAERTALRKKLSYSSNEVPFTVKEVVAYLDERYGSDDWEHAVEEAIREERAVVSGNKVERFPE